jgi:hypothetical protein
MLTTAVQFYQSQENLKCNVGYSWKIFPAIKIYEDPTKQIQLQKQKYITYTINEILEAGHSSVIFTEIKP